MSLTEIIEKRRAVFPDQYEEEAVSEETIKEILEAANWAPTHKRTEPWRFKVMLNESKNALGDFLAKKYQETTTSFSNFKYQKIQRKFQQSACVIVICMQPDLKAGLPEWEEVAATAMAVQNMWLRATELGIGSYWSTPTNMIFFNEFLPLEKGEKCLGFFYMGHCNEWPEGKRKTTIDEKTYWMY